MKAVMVSVNFDTQDVLTQWFEGDDPVLKADNFRSAIRDDFPDHWHHVFADEEAQQVAAARRVAELIGEPADAG